MKHLRKSLPYLSIIIISFVYLFSHQVAINAFNTTKIIITSLFPAIFPFMLFTALLIDLGGARIIGYLFQYIFLPLFNISGESSTLIFLGTFSGFPYSVVYGSEMVKNEPRKKEEIQAIINTIFFPSYNFVTVSIAILLADFKLGLIIICSLYLSGFILLFFASSFIKEKNRFKSWKEIQKENQEASKKISIKTIKDAIFSSLTSFINLAGVILIFSTISFLLSEFIPSNIYLYISPLIEITTGLYSLIDSGNCWDVLIPFYFGLSGISIIVQSYLFLYNSGLSFNSFLKYRLLQAILNSLVFIILVNLFK